MDSDLFCVRIQTSKLGNKKGTPASTQGQTTIQNMCALTK